MCVSCGNVFASTSVSFGGEGHVFEGCRERCPKCGYFAHILDAKYSIVGSSFLAAYKRGQEDKLKLLIKAAIAAYNDPSRTNELAEAAKSIDPRIERYFDQLSAKERRAYILFILKTAHICLQLIRAAVALIDDESGLLSEVFRWLEEVTRDVPIEELNPEDLNFPMDC